MLKELGNKYKFNVNENRYKNSNILLHSHLFDKQNNFILIVVKDYDNI